MTISSTTRVAGPFTGNGTASAFPFNWKVFAAADLDVVRRNTTSGIDTVLVLNTDYTVTLNGNQNTNPGGTVTLTAGALASGFTLTLTSDLANLQPTDLTNQGGFYPEVINDSLDRATIQIQQLAGEVSRSIRAPLADGSPAMVLPPSDVRSNSFLAFDSAGNPFAVASSSAGAPVGSTSAALVTYTQGGSGTITTNVQDKLRETISVKDFGAVGDGVADDTTAIQSALNYLNSVGGGGLFFPPGVYRKSDNTGSTLTMYSNITMYGVGDDSVIFFDDKDTVARSGNDFMLASNTANIAFRDLKITGTALTYRNQTNQKQLFTGANINGLRMVNVTIEKVRYMATAFSECNGVYMAGNRLDYIVRDGLRCTNSYNVIIANNVFRRVSDDAVALHALDALALPGSGFIVANNTFEECQGIKILGAKNALVTGNVFRRTLRGPIEIYLPASGIEGNTPQFSIAVTNNVIADTFAGFGSNYAILISQDIGRSDGGLATFPGINSVPYPYTYLNNIDSGTPVVLGQLGIKVSGNIISRSLPEGVAYSTYGYGLMWNRTVATFESDPTMAAANFAYHGILINAPATAIQVTDNLVSGTGPGLAGLVIGITGSANRQDVASMTISGNTFFDCPGLGIQLDALGSGTGAKQVVVQNNTFDLDPFFRNPTHNADNTWTSASSVVGIRLTNTIGWCAGGNVFKNCGSTGVMTAGVVESAPNIVYSDFVASGDNAGNKGVRAIPAAVCNLIIPINGDPTSASFGHIQNDVDVRLPSIPVSGRYVTGHRVLCTAPTVSGTPGSQYTITGWWRATTGSSHVLNTDWVEMRTLTGT